MYDPISEAWSTGVFPPRLTDLPLVAADTFGGNLVLFPSVFADDGSTRSYGGGKEVAPYAVELFDGERWYLVPLPKISDSPVVVVKYEPTQQ